MLELTVTDALVIILSAVTYIAIWLRKSSNRPLPPGPKGYPIIGNLFDMPATQEWLTYASWGKMYGKLCSVTIGRTTVIIINSYRDALDMLDIKGSIYSDRPHLAMVCDLMDLGKSVPIANGPLWKAQRTLLQKELGTHDRLKRYQVMQQEETHGFLRRLTVSPGRLKEHIWHYTAAVILSAAYGYKVEQEEDPFVLLVNESMAMAVVAVSGVFLVNHLPILKYIPSWFPGAGFQKFAARGRNLTHRMVNAPYDFVKRQMAQGNAQDSFTSSQISSGSSEEIIKWTAGTLFGAGAETTVSTIYSFFHLMVLNPEVQRRARDEIDTLLGPNTFPTFSDKDSLPYLNALLKEVLRFHPVGPLGVPHYTSDDDIQNGYFIPKNSVVFANIWQMCHDPEIYQDPMTFNPSRFLGDNPEHDPRDIVFGFGRRKCPGQLLAEASIYLLCASILAAFDIKPAVDDGGEPILPSYEYTSGLSSQPVPFECIVAPRSTRASSLVMD